MQLNRSWLGPVALLAGAAILVFGGLSRGDSAIATVGSMTGVTSTSINDADLQGQPECDFGGWSFGIKVDPVANGSYSGDGNTVTISNLRVAGGVMLFDWTATTPLSGVYVKASDGGILYTYDPPQLSDTGVKSAKNSISHINFCWNPPAATTTTTSTTVAPAAPPGPPIVENPVMPQDTPTSTTTPAAAPPALGAPALPVPAPSASVSSTSLPAAGVSTAATAPRGGLPTTGAFVAVSVVIGVALLAAGAVLLARSNRVAPPPA